MADTMTFKLQNDQLADAVNVAVTDMSTNQQVGNYVLNRDESADVQITADSWGKGKAFWTFSTTDGSINSNKQRDGIANGDECTLG